MPTPGRAARSAFPYLVLHREEFTWPRLLPKHAGELLPHHFTRDRPGAAGLLSVALVVIRLSANARTLSGSLPFGVRTFLLPTCGKRLPDLLRFKARQSIAKNVEHQKLSYAGWLISRTKKKNPEEIGGPSSFLSVDSRCLRSLRQLPKTRWRRLVSLFLRAPRR